MANFFSKISLARISLAHPSIQLVLLHANTLDIKPFQISCTHRNKVEQEKAFKEKLSKAKWLQSPHNYKPALAFDAFPIPLNWKDLKSFENMAVTILAIAKELKVSLTWGADWDNDGQTKDEKWLDRPHFQLTNWKELKNVR